MIYIICCAICAVTKYTHAKIIDAENHEDAKFKSIKFGYEQFPKGTYKNRGVSCNCFLLIDNDIIKSSKSSLTESAIEMINKEAI